MSQSCCWWSLDVVAGLRLLNLALEIYLDYIYSWVNFLQWRDFLKNPIQRERSCLFFFFFSFLPLSFRNPSTAMTNNCHFFYSWLVPPASSLFIFFIFFSFLLINSCLFTLLSTFDIAHAMRVFMQWVCTSNCINSFVML